jgi:hypothetical protein
MFDVRDFGAKGDGIFDDRPAIQAAIDASVAGGGDGVTVVIPAGTYIIGTKSSPTNQPLVVPSHIRLIGEGAGHTILRLPDDASQCAPWGSQAVDPTFADHLATLLINRGHIWWFGDGSLSLPVPPATDHIEIAHMTLDANNIGQPILYDRETRTSRWPAGLISAACAFSQLSNAYLHDLEICNAADCGLDLKAGFGTLESGVTNSRFERLWIHGNGWVGALVNGEASDLYFMDCVMEDNNKGAAITPR